MLDVRLVIGRLGKDPVVREAGDNLVANFSVCSEHVKGKPEWTNVVVWRKSAEFARDYLKKGSLVAVVGRTETRTYEKDGETVRITELQGWELKGIRTDGGGTKKQDEDSFDD